MNYFIISCYIILYYIILYYIILYYIILYYIILYYIILYYIILYYIILYYIISYYIILSYIVFYHIVLYYIIISYFILCNFHFALMADSGRYFLTGRYRSVRNVRSLKKSKQLYPDVSNVFRDLINAFRVKAEGRLSCDYVKNSENW